MENFMILNEWVIGWNLFCGETFMILFSKWSVEIYVLLCSETFMILYELVIGYNSLCYVVSVHDFVWLKGLLKSHRVKNQSFMILYDLS